MKFGRMSILPLTVVVLGLFSFTNYAYAVEPTVSIFTLNNVDKSNPIISDGDTITITFDRTTDRGGFPIGVFVGTVNVDNLFDFGDFIGNNYDGKWINNRTFVITIIDSTASSLQIGLTTFDPSVIPIHDEFAPADAWTLTSPSMELFIQSSNDECKNECQPPTLGLNKNNQRIVQNGFSYNGHSVNSELFYTAYPLIKTNTGVFNIAQLKIYEDSGPNNISHVELNFGLAKGETINEKRASISWDKHFDSTEVVSVNSPTNAIDRVKVESSIESCRENSNDQCLLLTIHHRFREPLDFDIVGTNVWDKNRNAWQNYFNHGIDVQGKSLNPPHTHKGIFHGKLFNLTEIEKNIAIDEDGNRWIFEKIWKMENKLNEKMDDEITSHLFARNHALFDTYMKGQELLAQHTLNSILGKKIQNMESEEPKTHYSEFLKRNEDVNLQKKILYEKHLATKTFNQLFDVKQNY